MSPKSTMPVIRPSSSTSALSIVKSVWTHWARNVGQRGTTTASNRSRTSATAARRPVSRMSGSIERVVRACWMSHSIVRCAFGWVKPRRARREPGGHLAPVADRRVAQRERVAPAVTGQHVVQPDEVGAVRRLDGGAVGRRAVPGRDRRPARVAAGRRGGSGPRVGRADGERLHVERGRILGRVRDLHDRQTLPGRPGQEECLVALAAEVRRGQRLDVRTCGSRRRRPRPRRTPGGATPGWRRSSARPGHASRLMIGPADMRGFGHVPAHGPRVHRSRGERRRRDGDPGRGRRVRSRSCPASGSAACRVSTPPSRSASRISRSSATRWSRSRSRGDRTPPRARWRC